nr:tailspike protein [Acinetobacter phage 3082-K84]
MNILRSFTETVVTTPTDTFPISFEYDEKYDAVHVFLNDVAVEDLGYTVSQVNAVTLKVEPAIPEGTVRIARETDIDKMKYIFDAGALFIDQNVDADFRQIVHSQQEVRDGFIKLRGDVLPLVHGLQEALQQAQEASEAAQEAADAAQEAAQLVQSAISNVESIADLFAIPNPKSGSLVYVKSYHTGLNKGGGFRIYDETKGSQNNGFTVINGWVLTTDRYSVEQAGARGDGETDDSSAIQNALTVLYPEISNRIQDFGPALWFDSKRYKVSNTVLLPPYANIMGGRSLMIGDAKSNDCFHSARYVDGILTDNTDETDLSNPLFYCRLAGFRYRDFDKSMHLKGWTQQCIVNDVESTACNQHLVTYGCYFLSVGDSTSDGVGLDLEAPKPAYVFEKSYGMLKFSGKIQASSCPIAYEYSQEQQAPTLGNLDAESCGIAIRFRNPIDVNNHGGFLITGCYFENCQTILDFVGMGNAVNVVLTYTVKNSFINCPDGALAQLNGSQNVKVIFNEEDNKVYQLKNLVVSGASNTILLSDTIKSANYNYTGGIAPNSPLDVTFVDKNIYGANGPTYGHWGQNFQRVVQWDGNSGRVQAKHNDYMRGMIPYTYYGNQGTPQDGIIPFCSHETQQISSSTMRLRVVTAIINNEMVQASFNLKVRSQANFGFVSGRFYNNKVVLDRNDFASAAFTITVESGVYVLIIDGIASTDASNYSVYGHVKLI